MCYVTRDKSGYPSGCGYADPTLDCGQYLVVCGATVDVSAGGCCGLDGGSAQSQDPWSLMLYKCTVQRRPYRASFFLRNQTKPSLPTRPGEF